VSVVAVVQGDDERSAVPAPLTERLALHLDLPTGYAADAALGAELGHPDEDRALVAAARQRLPGVELPRPAVAALCEAAEALGVASPRAAVLASRCARASAALEGRSSPDADDLARAVRLVLAPRATRRPVLEPPPDEPAAPEPPQPAPGSRAARRRSSRRRRRRTRDDDALGSPGGSDARPRSARRAAALRRTGHAAPRPARGAGQGRPRARPAARRLGPQGRGAPRRRARPTRGHAPGTPRGAARLDVIESLRAAAALAGVARRGAPPGRGRPRAQAPAPHRGGRARAARDPPRGPARAAPAAEDGHDDAVRRGRVGLGGARAPGRGQGRVELLLAESYVRRDRVGLIAFKGSDVGAAPAADARPHARAPRHRRAAGRRGTPLAAALVQAAATVDEVLRGGARAAVVDAHRRAGEHRPRRHARAPARVGGLAGGGARPARALGARRRGRHVATRRRERACPRRGVRRALRRPPVVTARALHAKVREAIADDAARPPAA
jgi:magnesium chelatase subunit D